MLRGEKTDMSENIDELRSKLGDVDASLATVAAIWVGTDETLEMTRQWAQSQADWKSRALALLERLDCDPEGARFSGNTLVGFVPRDLENLPEGLVQDGQMFIARAGTEAGDEIIEEVAEINAEFRTLEQVIGGLHGAEYLSEGNEPKVVIGNGSHPVMYLVHDETDSVRGRIMADPQLWTQVALSDVAALV